MLNQKTHFQAKDCLKLYLLDFGTKIVKFIKKNRMIVECHLVTKGNDNHFYVLQQKRVKLSGMK